MLGSTWWVGAELSAGGRASATEKDLLR